MRNKQFSNVTFVLFFDPFYSFGTWRGISVYAESRNVTYVNETEVYLNICKDKCGRFYLNYLTAFLL